MICKGCNLDKQKEDFPVRNDRSGRLRPYCKECANTAQKSRYKSHKASNPFLHKCTRSKTRANALSLPFDLTPEYLEGIWTGKCPVLKVDISLYSDRLDEYAAELDRLVPNLGYVKGNVNFLSRKANRIKNNSTVEILENLLEWMKNVPN
jgi:hypothetical protein